MTTGCARNDQLVDDDRQASVGMSSAEGEMMGAKKLVTGGRLAIASPFSSVRSETFIQMQIEQLGCRLRMHGGSRVNATIPGGAIKPLHSFRGVVDTLYQRGLRRGGKEAPQEAELKRRMKNQGINVVLANFGPCGVALSPICKELGIPLVVHFHGYDAHEKRIIDRFEEEYRQLGRDCAQIIVVSERMRDALHLLGVPSEKMTLVRYGVYPDRFSVRGTPPVDPVFFGVGRFVDKKAPYLTLLAFKQVHSRIPSARLVLAGDGELLEATRNLTEALGLSDVVELPGSLPHEAVAERMQGATAFVQHSVTPRSGPQEGDSEGTPVVILEAMMTGLPIVSTKHAGIGEVIDDGVSGYVVAERDVDGMAEAMFRVAESPEEGARVGLAAREKAMREYKAEDYIGSLRRVLGEVL